MHDPTFIGKSYVIVPGLGPPPEAKDPVFRAYQLVEKLGFCGCGTDEGKFGRLRDILAVFDNRPTPAEQEYERQVELAEPDKVFNSAMLARMAGGTPESNARWDRVWAFLHTDYGELIANFLDGKGLLEHGTSLTGGAWLTEDGAVLLDFLKAQGIDDDEWRIEGKDYQTWWSDKETAAAES
jgi:hypothetical protein